MLVLPLFPTPIISKVNIYDTDSTGSVGSDGSRTRECQ